MKLRPSILLICLTSAACAQTPQTPASPQPEIATFHAKANLVVVDVVVTDRESNPIKGLKREDFTLSEDKRQQTLVSFDEHTAPPAGESVRAPLTPKLPPGVFTNVATAPVNSAIDVLLIDSLNTPMVDQNYVHQQVIDYLKSAHPGTRVAIFGLGVRLVMLQGFTDDPSNLLHAAEHVWTKASPLVANSGGGAPTESTSDLASALGFSTAAANLQLFESEINAGIQNQSADLTLQGLNILARYLSGIPGRKNVMWFSGNFPINLLAKLNFNGGAFGNASLDLPSGEAQYRKTVNLLTRAQVALYPIDAMGVRSSPAFEAAGGASLVPVTPLNDTSATDNGFVHQAMNTLAEDSGGHAFYNRNNLTQALSDAIQLGSNYYTLTYTPNNPKDKDDFRNIEVKLDKKGYRLEYRRGYFADSANPADAARAVSVSSAPDTAPLRKAMIHGVPGPTEILFKIRALPIEGTPTEPALNNHFTADGLKEANGKFQNFLIDFDTEAHNYAFTPNPDGTFHLKAEFDAIVYQREGKLINLVPSTLNADVSAAQRTALLNRGIPFRLQVSVPTTGEHTIRIGVHDFASDHVGSIEFPVAAVAHLPAIPPPAVKQPQPKPAPSN
jgi:VWFA-related protein